jgi:hypothetical protein
MIDSSVFKHELIRTGLRTADSVGLGRGCLGGEGCWCVQSKKTKKRDKIKVKAAVSFHMAQVVAPGQCHTVPKWAEAEAEGSEKEEAENAQEADELFPWLHTQQAEEEAEEEGNGDEEAMLAAMLGRQRAASRRRAQSEQEEQESEGFADEADDDDDEMLAAVMDRNQRGRAAAAEEKPSEHSEDKASVRQVNSGEVDQPAETTVCAGAASEEAKLAEGNGEKAAEGEENDKQGGKRGGKAKEKRAKRAVQSIQKELSVAAEASADDPFACKVRCGHSLGMDLRDRSSVLNRTSTRFYSFADSSIGWEQWNAWSVLRFFLTWDWPGWWRCRCAAQVGRANPSCSSTSSRPGMRR